RRFVDNRVIAQLRINNALKQYQESKRISWNINPDLPKILYNQMVKWEPYIKYMKDEKTGYSEDKKFITKLVTEFFPSSEELLNAFEEQSIYWNDDIDYISLMVEKTLKKFKANSGPEVPLMPLFKNEDDEHFVKHLFRQAILKTKQNIELIDRNTTNWEVERIALMDRLVMQLAITEIVEFEEIPVKVTLNEYIEIAKQYCTSKSSNFVNGILDKIVRDMREKGLFRKSGRGLLGETE
ncbi:MAG TPA: transcription antitermination factor NusB, partial [Bacteroidales bacterium]|nr:transcription antitermination factor NusB [Bacteroidales bacterium]